MAEMRTALDADTGAAHPAFSPVGFRHEASATSCVAAFRSHLQTRSVGAGLRSRNVRRRIARPHGAVLRYDDAAEKLPSMEVRQHQKK